MRLMHLGIYYLYYHKDVGSNSYIINNQ